MPRKVTKPEERATLEIYFPMTRKKKLKERRMLFKKMKSLIEGDRGSFPTKDISFRKNTIILDTDEFGFLVSFEKPISLQMGIGKDLEKNKNRVNDLTNKLVNYINTILGVSAKHAKVSASWFITNRKGMDLARIFVDETRLAKINELIKKTLNPRGILFDYTTKRHENNIVHFHSKDVTLIAILANCEHKEGIPWDLTIEEYNNMKESIKIIERLGQKEF